MRTEPTLLFWGVVMKKTGLKLLTSLVLTAAMMFSSGGFLVADTDPLPSEIVIDDNTFRMLCSVII